MKNRTDANRISGWYAVAGTVWVTVSDLAVASAFDDFDANELPQFAKGLFFIWGTALILRWLLLKEWDTQSQLKEERVELALKGADLGLWDWNVQTGEVYYDERFIRMLGYTPEEFAPRLSTWENLLHPEDAPRVQAALKAHLAGQTDIYETEHRLRGKSGQWVWVLDCGRVLEKDEQGRPLRAVGTHLDITARKEAEAELSRRMEQLKHANEDLRRFNEAAVNRELRMIELKREINHLHESTGRPPPYKLDFADVSP